MKIKFTHILFLIILLLVVDLFFNQGRILADIAASANGRPALVLPELTNQGLTNNMPPRNDTITIDTSPATVVFVQPEFPTAVPQQVPPATAAPVVIQNSDPSPAPAIIMIQAEPETETTGCRGGRSCPRPTAAPTPGVGR